MSVRRKGSKPLKAPQRLNFKTALHKSSAVFYAGVIFRQGAGTAAPACVCASMHALCGMPRGDGTRLWLAGGGEPVGIAGAVLENRTCKFFRMFEHLHAVFAGEGFDFLRVVGAGKVGSGFAEP